jgi:hypothetical protein
LIARRTPDNNVATETNQDNGQEWHVDICAGLRRCSRQHAMRQDKGPVDNHVGLPQVRRQDSNTSSNDRCVDLDDVNADVGKLKNNVSEAGGHRDRVRALRNRR